jgi:uncharacterized iron-regulated protein
MAEISLSYAPVKRASRVARWMLLPGCALFAAGCATAAPAQVPAPVQVQAPRPVHTAAAQVAGYTPHRVYDVAAAAFIDFETLAARAVAADVVLFGELHGNTAGHRLQHALLDGVGRRGDATLSMEMFERDVAEIVSGYARGVVDHASFLERARPWPRYFPDYHPLVEEARGRGWPVVAANVPRVLANRVAQEGLAALETLDSAARRHAAAELYCPDDDYRARFITAMTRHPSADGVPDEAAELVRQQRYYESQCLKDETMAESIVMALAAGAPRPVVHLTGAFHSDHGDGIPVRIARRDPSLAMITLTLVPVADLDALDPAPHAPRADYLIFTLQPPPRQPAP